MDPQETIKQVDDLNRRISQAEKDKAKLEGEKIQLDKQKEECIKQCRDEFDMSLKDLKRILPEWEKELEEELIRIQNRVKEMTDDESGDD